MKIMKCLFALSFCLLLSLPRAALLNQMARCAARLQLAARRNPPTTCG
jgi:hypothetical protein